jgi:hypothetical protein
MKDEKEGRKSDLPFHPSSFIGRQAGESTVISAKSRHMTDGR